MNVTDYAKPVSIGRKPFNLTNSSKEIRLKKQIVMFLVKMVVIINAGP